MAVNWEGKTWYHILSSNATNLPSTGSTKKSRFKDFQEVSTHGPGRLQCWVRISPTLGTNIAPWPQAFWWTALLTQRIFEQLFYFIYLFYLFILFWTESIITWQVCSGSRLTTTSASRVQTYSPAQLPQQLGLQAYPRPPILFLMWWGFHHVVQAGLELWPHNPPPWPLKAGAQACEPLRPTSEQFLIRSIIYLQNGLRD